MKIQQITLVAAFAVTIHVVPASAQVMSRTLPTQEFFDQGDRGENIYSAYGQVGNSFDMIGVEAELDFVLSGANTPPTVQYQFPDARIAGAGTLVKFSWDSSSPTTPIKFDLGMGNTVITRPYIPFEKLDVIAFSSNFQSAFVALEEVKINGVTYFSLVQAAGFDAQIVEFSNFAPGPYEASFLAKLYSSTTNQQVFGQSIGFQFTTVVPEPTSFALLVFGTGFFLARRRAACSAG